MADVVDATTRSRMMSGIRGKDTRPEMLLRSALHKRGFRFRLHYGKLPGKPDLVFPRRKALIQINGCFWHGHNCHLFKWPKTRAEFWKKKISSNMVRDQNNHQAYRKEGWRVLTIWECALKGKGKLKTDQLVNKTSSWLESDSDFDQIAGLCDS